MGRRRTYDRPAVIILTRYVRCPGRGACRDPSWRAASRRPPVRYCGKAASTIDHVLPRSRGGKDTWENLVACCLACNNIKGDRTPQEMRWELRLVPAPPHGSSWTVRGVDKSDPRWEPYLALAA